MPLPADFVTRQSASHVVSRADVDTNFELMEDEDDHSATALTAGMTAIIHFYYRKQSTTNTDIDIHKTSETVADPCVCVLAGEYFTVKPGYWYCLRVYEPAVLVYCRWLTYFGGIQSLYMAQVHQKERNRTMRLAYLMPRNTKFSGEWIRFVEYLCNHLYGGHVNYPFKFLDGVKVTTWGLTGGLPAPLEHGTKPRMIFALASLAQACGRKDATMVGEVPNRMWGRLTNWCKVHLGSSTTQAERERRRPGRPRDSDVEMEGEE
jgi:hypothetical protein